MGTNANRTSCVLLWIAIIGAVWGAFSWHTARVKRSLEANRQVASVPPAEFRLPQFTQRGVLVPLVGRQPNVFVPVKAEVDEGDLTSTPLEQIMEAKKLIREAEEIENRVAERMLPSAPKAEVDENEAPPPPAYGASVLDVGTLMRESLRLQAEVLKAQRQRVGNLSELEVEQEKVETLKQLRIIDQRISDSYKDRLENYQRRLKEVEAERDYAAAQWKKAAAELDGAVILEMECGNTDSKKTKDGLYYGAMLSYHSGSLASVNAILAIRNWPTDLGLKPRRKYKVTVTLIEETEGAK